MAKFEMIIMFILFSVTHTIVASSQGPQPVDAWFQNLKRKKAVITTYVQDNIGPSPGQTVFEIARSNITSTSPTSFGQLFMSDDLVTQGPDPNSKPLGHTQGLVGFCDLNKISLCLLVNFYFKGGPYNGSTISVMGRNPLQNAARELSIVGGTGFFRLVQGVAVASTYMNFNATGYAIFKYVFYVIFY